MSVVLLALHMWHVSPNFASQEQGNYWHRGAFAHGNRRSSKRAQKARITTTATPTVDATVAAAAPTAPTPTGGLF